MANRDNHDTTRHERPVASASSGSSPVVRRSGGWKAHLLLFAVTLLMVWGVGAYAYIYFSPRLLYDGLENAVVSGRGSGVPGIPINTLYTQPTLASPSRSNSLESTENRDTLYTIGWLDLSNGPQVLHVPDMAGRYYAVQLTDPWGTDFAYVSRRTTGTQAGDYLISGPDWHGTVPAGVTQQIVSPNNTVLVIGRTLVESDSDSDLATAYGLAKQIQVTPLSQWYPNQSRSIGVLLSCRHAERRYRASVWAGHQSSKESPDEATSWRHHPRNPRHHLWHLQPAPRPSGTAWVSYFSLRCGAPGCSV